MDPRGKKPRKKAIPNLKHEIKKQKQWFIFENIKKHCCFSLVYRALPWHVLIFNPLELDPGFNKSLTRIWIYIRISMCADTKHCSNKHTNHVNFIQFVLYMIRIVMQHRERPKPSKVILYKKTSGGGEGVGGRQPSTAAPVQIIISPLAETGIWFLATVQINWLPTKKLLARSH